MVPTGNKSKCLSLVNHTTIHHHQLINQQLKLKLKVHHLLAKYIKKKKKKNYQVLRGKLVTNIKVDIVKYVSDQKMLEVKHRKNKETLYEFSKFSLQNLSCKNQ